MEPVTAANLKAFLQRLGERYPRPARLYLLGGSALCLLGSSTISRLSCPGRSRPTSSPANFGTTLKKSGAGSLPTCPGAVETCPGGSEDNMPNLVNSFDKVFANRNLGTF